MTRVDKVAAERERIHKHHASGRQLSKYSTHKVGLAAEHIFSVCFKQEVDWTLRPGGDGGVDFTIDGMTIDVKGATKKPPFLLREVNKKDAADIFVLCALNMECRTGKLLGWAFDADCVTYPTGCMPGQNVLNHKVPVEDLRPMPTLRHAKWLRGYGP